MGKTKIKYYAVKVGRKPGIYTTWNDCQKQVNKYPKAVFKSFTTLEEAEKFANYKGITKTKNNKDKKAQHKSIKICSICEKPHKAKTQCCLSCSRKLHDIKPIVEPFSKQKKVSITKVINIKVKYNVTDVFEFIKKNPSVWKTLDSHKKRLEVKRTLREYHRSDEYRYSNYKKWEGDIPLYILEIFKNSPTKQFISLSGNKLNPYVHYLCTLCGEEQTQLYQDLKNNKGHNCTKSKSSGEIIVEDYLKNICNIKTQFDTLKCINPITNRQLPYDIEIVDKKILVEIQGEQHLKFIEYFHGTIENFHYQQRKDAYKKKFAESKGYKLIYIYYDELKNGSFKTKFDNILSLLSV